MKLLVPILGQRQLPWSSQRLGTVDGTTIGNEGCLITSCCMIAQYYGKDMTPDKFDNWLTDNNGYVDGNMYNSDALSWYYGDIKHTSTVMCTDIPAPIDRINESLNNGFPVIIGVNFLQTANIPTHFVVIVGRMDDGTYIINDPWYQDQVFLTARYGKDQAQNILECIFYQGPQVHFADAPAPVAPQPVIVTPNIAVQPLSDPTPKPNPVTIPVVPTPDPLPLPEVSIPPIVVSPTPPEVPKLPSSRLGRLLYQLALLFG
jgi:uncharacterized protein YvpB